MGPQWFERKSADDGTAREQSSCAGRAEQSVDSEGSQREDDPQRLLAQRMELEADPVFQCTAETASENFSDAGGASGEFTGPGTWNRMHDTR